MKGYVLDQPSQDNVRADFGIGAGQSDWSAGRLQSGATLTPQEVQNAFQAVTGGAIGASNMTLDQYLADPRTPIKVENGQYVYRPEAVTDSRGDFIAPDDAGQILNGNAGQDMIFGGGGADTLNGNAGANLLDGGAPFYACYEAADGGWLSVAPLEPKAELYRCNGCGAEFIGISERTVNFHLNQVTNKTDSKNRNQAIAKSKDLT